MRRREVVCGSNNKTQNVVLDCDHLTDTTTPTRRLEFGNESSTLDGSHPLARRVWERDITAFLASRSYVSFTRDPLLELKLDETQVVPGERGEGDEEEAVASSRKLSVSHSTSVPLHARQEATQTEDKDKAEERQQQPQVGCSLESKPLLLSPSRYTAEEEEEPVIIGRDLVYPTADTFSIHGLKKNVPVVDRGSSTPCLIPTPDTHAHKRDQVVSQSTATECMPSLVMQEFSPGQHANVFPFRLWNSHSQEETGATFPETINNDVGMKGTRPPSLPPQQQRQQEDSAESFLHCSPRKNAMRRRVVGVKKRKNSAFVKSLVAPTSKNCGVEEEDAPLLHPARSVKQPIKKETDSMADASRPPHYTVGMRVEGRWGCRWFAAVVTEEEKNGYVQICWDEDGSFLHMKVREVRLPHDEGRKTENRLNASPPTMTATQLVELMDSDTPCHPVPMKNTLRLSPLNESDYVSLSLISVYLTPASRLYLAEKWSVLEKMVENGMTIVESPLDLESDSLTSSSDCHAGADECMSFFVVTEEDAKENEGRMITIAHAMGLSAVSVAWLEEIKDDELEECFQRLRVPRPKDLVGQGSDTCLRWKVLDSKSERFLSHKTIYLTGEDTDIVFLLQVCGGTVTYRLPSNGVSSPHYVYVAPGKQAKVIPSIASVILLEKSWLIQRIHELFMALPQSRYNRRNNDNNTNTNTTTTNNNNNDTVNQVLAGCPLSGTKHPREVMDGKRNMTETMPPSPMAVAEQEESRVQLQKDVANGVPEVFLGEDYYFRMPPVRGKDKNNRRKENETHVVELGRVVSLRGGDGVVTLQLYSVKHTLLRQNPRTGSLENHTTVYLGTRTATVSVEDLLFNIPVYVVDASQMQHVYTLESPPRGMDSVTVGGGVSQRMDMRVAAEEESMYRRRMEEKESPAFCPEGLSYSSSSPRGDTSLRYGNQDNAVLKEILVNGWQIRSGVDVRFHDYLSSTRSVKCSSDGESTGRVQMIQRVASGVVLVVHKVDASDDSSESKMVVITPDMVTGIV